MISKQVRILSVALTSRGFGYCIMEGQAMLECGHKEVWGNKNALSVSKIEQLMNQFLPAVLVLQDVNAPNARRWPRIKSLHLQVVRLAEQH